MSAQTARSGLAGSVMQELDDRRAAMVALLRELVAIETPTENRVAQERLLDRLQTELENRGLRSRRWRGSERGGQLMAEPRATPRHAPRQLLLGHGDTVWPVGTLAGMPIRVEDGRFSGPGCYDMKAGLVQMLFAIEVARDLEPQMSVAPLVFVNTDEEKGSTESTRRIRRLARVADRAFVLEPSIGPSGKLKTERKGSAKYVVRVTGRAAHAADPHEGASAILELSRVVQKVFELNDPAGGVTVNVGTIGGGTQPNVVAAEGRAEVDVRTPSRRAARDVEARLRTIETQTPGTRVEIRGGRGRPPLEHTPRNRKLWRRACRAATELGIEIDEGRAGGGSDGSTSSLYTATLDGLGAVGGGAHASHEFVDIERTIERTALLSMLLLDPPLRADRPGGADRPGQEEQGGAW